MTPRPPTHREPTDDEMQCLPEGALWFDTYERTWEPSELIGMAASDAKENYAIPITQHGYESEKSF